MMTFFRLSTPLCILCTTLYQAAAFSTLPPLTTTRVHASSSASSSASTARNLFFGAYLPLGIPVLLAKDKWDSSRRTKLKEQILNLASETKRGLTATDAQQEEMQGLFAQLEKFNPTVNPITNKFSMSMLTGDWSLDYTTSDSILGKGGFPRIGPSKLVVYTFCSLTVIYHNIVCVSHVSHLSHA